MEHISKTGALAKQYSKHIVIDNVDMSDRTGGAL